MYIELTDIDPASVESSHRDIEALSFMAQPVGHWNSAVLKYHRSGWLGVPAHLQRGAQVKFMAQN